ncbi:Pkinase-domain-containing protein [Lichtheimia hyalospora FSU 10163]|nr:Pkinase-domain-containing protein [Lichtheimia hyalospora FSU 10163]
MFAFEEAVLGLSDNLITTSLSDNDDDRSSTSTLASHSMSHSKTSNYTMPIDQKYIASVVDESYRKIGSHDFDRLCVLGRGAFGKVYLVQHHTSRSLYAMKVLKKASLRLHVNHIKTEREILEQVHHPFIVQLYYAFQTSDELHMILEYAMGGELFRYLDQAGTFTESMASFYAAELVLALSHLHSLGIIYRDLKPENCLLDKSGHILLTDFGLSKTSLDGKTNTICGTVEYMAPEVLAGLKYDYTVDWWSLGILIYDMLTGSPPYKGKDRDETMHLIMSKNVVMPYYFSSEAKDLVAKLLRKNPHLRLGARRKDMKTILSHDFFRDMDWAALLDRRVEPPIIPIITNPAAAENFDSMFTSEPITTTSTEIPSPFAFDHFRNFSYVADISVYS